MEDRLLTVKQLAGYLSVNERTVLKLVQEGVLPGVKIGNQWRFRRAMIDTWLDDQMLGITPRTIERAAPSVPHHAVTLESCFRPAHICAELESTTKLAAVVELAGHARRLDLVSDETWFVGALIQRENVMPSAMGNGFAVLHTLRRHPERVVRPFMILGRSRAGIDFDALDGRRTHLLFVLGLKYDELHIPWLAKLIHMLNLPEVLPQLLAAEDANAIHDLLLDTERALTPANEVGT